MPVLVRMAAAMVLAFSLGLHWAALQVVAWTGMIVTYSRETSLVEALGKTFDGEHPCKLCLAIQDGRAQEKKQEQQQTKPSSKLDLGLLAEPFRWAFSLPQGWPLPRSFQAVSRSDPPPKPRPKLPASIPA